FDQAMADVYAARSGAAADQVAKWMDAETYMSGSVAVERGFADALLPADQVTVDDDAKAGDQNANKLRAMELTLVSAGMTRSQARARINELKGTPGAAQPAPTPGAGVDPWAAAAAAALASWQAG